MLATVAVILITLVLPSTGLGRLFGFVPLPPVFLLVLALILVAYGATAELVKRWFYRLESERHRCASAAPHPAGPSPDC
jgi:Mg2+-importing ATPase